MQTSDAPARRTATKAARLILFRDLQRAGYLHDLTLQAIGDRFGVNRSTVLRDLRALELVGPELERLRDQWRAGDLPTVDKGEGG